MNLFGLDTLSCYDHLREAGLEDRAAKAILEVLSGVVASAVANKEAVAAMHKDLKTDIANLTKVCGRD